MGGWGGGSLIWVLVKCDFIGLLLIEIIWLWVFVLSLIGLLKMEFLLMGVYGKVFLRGMIV